MQKSVPSRRSFVAGCAATAISVAAPFAGSAALPSSTLRVLTIGSDVGDLPFYAQENGFFLRAGLNVEVSTMGNGGAVLAAVAGDAVDIGFANAGSVAAGILRGLPFTVIADGALYISGRPITLLPTVLCVAPNSQIKAPKDLIGKKIAVNGLKLIGQAAVEAWMDKNGADSKSVGFIEMSFSAMAPLLESGGIDAALIAEPALSAARGRVRVFADPFAAVGSEFSLSAYMAKADWVAKNRDLAARFSAVMRQSAGWANANPQMAERILAKYLKIPEAVASTMARVQYPTSLQASHLQPVIDVMANYGFLTKRVSAEDLITQV